MSHGIIPPGKKFDPYVIRTRNLLIWSQTRYRCAKESLQQRNIYHIINQIHNTVNILTRSSKSDLGLVLGWGKIWLGDI